MRRALLATFAGLLVLATACSGATTGGEGSVELTGDDIGTAVVPGLGEGTPTIDLASFRGTPVVLNFWASTCPPCVREMPAFESVNQAADGDVVFVGVAVNDRVDAALRMAERTGVTYLLGTDPRGELFASAGAVLLPTTIIIDADGNVARRLVGETTADELVQALAEETGVEVSR